MLKEFISQIRIRKFPILVEDLEAGFEEATGELEYFEIKRGDWKEELGERLDIAGRLLYRSVELGERSLELGEKSVEIGRTMLGKQEEMLKKQDETISEIRGLREDLKMYMDERFKRIEKDIAEIKVKLGMI